MNRQRLRLEFRDLLELVLLPGLAAVLPWAICFRVFKWLAHIPSLYREPCERALEQATQRGWVGQEPGAAARWIWSRRLVTLVDHADFYLGRTRSDAWMRRHLEVEGHWCPPDQAALLCTFHWGAGMWGLRHAHAQGLKPHALVAALNGDHFKGRSVLHWYARARTQAVTDALGQPAMDVSVSLRPAIKALRSNEQVLAAIDVPADQVVSSEVVSLAGMPARVPRGLLRLAVDQKIPVVLYITGLNLDTGRRHLRMRVWGVGDDVSTLAQAVFAELDGLIRQCPPAWHFWSEAPRFFIEASELAAAAAVEAQAATAIAPVEAEAAANA
ncbi:hypothetical protein PSQ20_13905 [Curvibacter sp. RS43]|uniref:hypothetical protein n=1 Tax=Curvibacter microcysteis TaxID=3026419 RepID=UPI0023606F68|nr:hypothetical protein [Curvibacter sp. RS43]MDD0811445.1 hypothetical protein [Curvibacter sp. RS43]